MKNVNQLIAPKKPGRISKKPESVELLKAYQTSTASELATQYGVSVNTIYVWVREAKNEIK